MLKGVANSNATGGPGVFTTITGTTITATTQFVAPNGSNTATGIQLGPNGGYGFYYDAVYGTIFAVNQSRYFGFGGGNSGFGIASSQRMWWSSTDTVAGSPDTSLSRASGGVLAGGTGNAGTFDGTFKAVAYQQAGANGQILAVQQLTELTTIAAAATTDTTIQMPAGAVVLAVDVRVTTVIPTAANFTVGDSGSAARFSTAAVSSAATSTDPGTKAGAYYNASALSVRITPNAQPADNTGRVRVTIHYIQVTPATS